MFKPLLRTLPTLSGNFTIACKLNEITKDSANDYSAYVRVASIIPLQNILSKKEIELNLLNGKYEYDISKYHYYYSNFFYRENFQYDKKNYAMLNLNSLYDYVNDGRNKDYEFGCKRIRYNQNNYQFNFYAPFYLDNKDDMPEYFCIHIVLNDHLEKTIKIYLNKINKKNYLKTYLDRYLNQIDDRVIFCLPESLQATYFGIDIKNGGIVQYKDNVIGNIYVNQTTINNFDYSICQGFERNSLIMRQVIPLSFSFNLNDLFNKYEKDFFAGTRIKVYGHYYSKNDIQYDMYDFDINYTNMYQRYKKYDEYTGMYEYTTGADSLGNVINIMNIGFPALNESKYIKYAYTNKITPKYCKFKLLYSSDNDPYITNANFAYSYIQYSNQKYGYFPTMFKDIYPNAIVSDKDFKLPIGYDLDNYYKVVKYASNKVYVNTINIDKYFKLMSNYNSSWYNIDDYNPDFNDDNILKIFKKNELWVDIHYDNAYFKGILYNLNFLKEYNVNKFGVFLGVNMNYISQDELDNTIIKAKYILSNNLDDSYVSTKFSTLNQYNDSLDMTLKGTNGSIYYNKIFDVSTNSIVFENKSNKYIISDQNVIKDIKGTYIEESNYLEENTYYKLSDVILNLSSYFNTNTNAIINRFNDLQTTGYILLDGYNNINYYEEYEDTYKNIYKRFILSKRVYNTNEYNKQFNWLSSTLYYSTETNINKNEVNQISSIIDDEYNTELNGKYCMFLKTIFIHKTDIANVLKEFNLFKVFGILNKLESYIYEPIGTYNGIEINNYFIKNEDISELNVFVDTYNLKDYINQYKEKFNIKKEIDISNVSDHYIRVINKDHILEYWKRLNRDANNITTFSPYSNILDNLYVKERCWLIEENEMRGVDRYITLYDYLKRYDIDLSIALHAYDDSLLINWILENISDERNTNYNFIFNFNKQTIELDLYFKKQLVKLTNELKEIIKNGYFLYLYVNDKFTYENLSMWPIVSYNDINNAIIDNSTNKYDYKNINEGLKPLFNDPYLNDNDCATINNMIYTYKINSNNNYVLNTGKYFKEIDVWNEIIRICTNDNNFIYNWIEEINSLLTDEELYVLKDNWSAYCLNNSIYIEDLNKYDTDIENYKNILDNALNEYNLVHPYSKIKYYDDLKTNKDDLYRYNYYKDEKYNLCKSYVEHIMTYLKEYGYESIYYQIIKNKGLILYSISKLLDISFSNVICNDNIIYNDDYKIYICNYNGVKYAFYWISLNVDNTNNSFNIANDYNLNTIFESINGISINSEKFKIYLKNIFYLINPFLKINLFNSLAKYISSIVYPYESEIKIDYIQSLLNENEYNKYSMLKENDNDLLYKEIIKISEQKKIKLLRYYNYITPYIKKTDIIEDCWELKYMNPNNIYKNIKKYNIFKKSNINIYKYNGIDVYDGIFNNKKYEFNICDNINQYEYKHFEDNILFNLPEEIILEDDKQYKQSELKTFKENTDAIKRKKLNILLKFFNKKGLDYKNIILFLFNKYDSNMIIERIKTRSSISEKLYKISYKFNLL